MPNPSPTPIPPWRGLSNFECIVPTHSLSMPLVPVLSRPQGCAYEPIPAKPPPPDIL
jgi:hypothetical protein